MAEIEKSDIAGSGENEARICMDATAHQEYKNERVRKREAREQKKST